MEGQDERQNRKVLVTNGRTTDSVMTKEMVRVDNGKETFNCKQWT